MKIGGVINEMGKSAQLLLYSSTYWLISRVRFLGYLQLISPEGFRVAVRG